jgi:hypothetical protein
MIYCKELNKSFENTTDLFKELKLNEDFILCLKKNTIYKSIDKGLEIKTNQNDIIKSFDNDTKKALKLDQEKNYYFVVNSSNILDSHNDMHVKGNWEKTVNEQQGKTYLLFDHELKRSEIIAMKNDIRMFTANIPFSLIGKNYEGKTYVLIYEIAKDKIIHKQAKEWLEDGYNFEASVRMQYIKIEPAYNSNEEEFAKQKATYDTYYPLIANKDDYKEIPYFYVVKEAKNTFESSLVLFGSNGATGLIEEKVVVDDTTTIIQEPTDVVTQKRKTYLLI